VNHHHRPGPPDGLDPKDALRLRFWMGGELRDEVWLDTSDPRAAELAEFCSTYHAAQAELADAAGVAWLVEVYNPELPEENAYVRFGTDTDGMVAPIAIIGFGA
jgi:hypothetical protein